MTATVSEIVEEILSHLKNEPSLAAKQRVALENVHNLYHTTVRTDILNILLPVISRLRDRITRGDVHFFASDAFLTKVTAAVDARCADVVKAGKMTEEMKTEVGPALQPILQGIQKMALNYLGGDIAPFEFLVEKLNETLTLSQ